MTEECMTDFTNSAGLLTGARDDLFTDTISTEDPATMSTVKLLFPGYEGDLDDP